MIEVEKAIGYILLGAECFQVVGELLVVVIKSLLYLVLLVIQDLLGKVLLLVVSFLNAYWQWSSHANLEAPLNILKNKKQSIETNTIYKSTNFLTKWTWSPNSMFSESKNIFKIFFIKSFEIWVNMPNNLHAGLNSNKNISLQEISTIYNPINLDST